LAKVLSLGTPFFGDIRRVFPEFPYGDSGKPLGIPIGFSPLWKIGFSAVLLKRAQNGVLTRDSLAVAGERKSV